MAISRRKDRKKCSLNYPVLAVYGVGEHDAAELEKTLSASTGALVVRTLDWSIYSWVPSNLFGSLSYTYLAELMPALRITAKRSVASTTGKSDPEAASRFLRVAMSIADRTSLIVAFGLILLLFRHFPRILVAFSPKEHIPTILRTLADIFDWGLGVDIVTCGFVLVGAALQASSVSFLAVFRRLFLLHLSPLLYCTLLPLSINPLLFAVPLILLYSIFANFAENVGAPSEFQDGSWLGLILGIILARYGPYMAQAFVSLCVGPVRPLLKIIADVIMYLGNGSYRTNIRSLFFKEFAGAASAGTPVLIAAHSLGSVIATDMLRFRSPAVKLILVTGGSPLKRWFHRFFSADYPVPSDLGRDITSGGQVCWINVFRPSDPIGTSLSEGKSEFIHDVDTEQHERGILDAHVGYFADPWVHKVVGDQIATLRASGDHLVRPSEPPVVSEPLPSGVMPGLDKGVPSAASPYALAALFTLAAYVLAMVNTWVWYPQQRAIDNRHLISRLDSIGRLTESEITRVQDVAVDYDPPPTEKEIVSYKISFRCEGCRGGYFEAHGPFYWMNEGAVVNLKWTPPLPKRNYLEAGHWVSTARISVKYLSAPHVQFYAPEIAGAGYDSGLRSRQMQQSLALTLFGIPVLGLTFCWLFLAYFGRQIRYVDEASRYARANSGLPKRAG